MPFPTYKTKDEIPEAFRSAYVEKGGEWVPDIEDVSGLKASQKRILDEKTKLEESLSKVLGGRKLDEVADLLKKHETAEEERQRKAGEHDKILEKRLKELRDEYEPKVKAGEEAMSKLQKREFEDAVWEAAKKAGALDSDRKYILKAAESDYVRRDKSGKLVVVDGDGDPTGEDLDKLFSGRFKTDFPKAYAASGGSGGGANGGNGGKSAAEKGAKTVSANDNAGFLANLDTIAKGQTKVVAE